MKDMSRNAERDGRMSLKEKMFRRAEETRSLMMSRTGFKANGSENGHVGRTSPIGTEHQSSIKIKVLNQSMKQITHWLKIEREGDNDVATGPQTTTNL